MCMILNELYNFKMNKLIQFANFIHYRNNMASQGPPCSQNNLGKEK